MTYRIELKDDVVEEVVRLSKRARDAWTLCCRELENDPWPKVTRDFSIDERVTISGETIYLMTADWFGAAIAYDAIKYDEPVDGDEGLVAVFSLRWIRRS